jgi:hypothetical protein
MKLLKANPAERLTSPGCSGEKHPSRRPEEVRPRAANVAVRNVSCGANPPFAGEKALCRTIDAGQGKIRQLRQ